MLGDPFRSGPRFLGQRATTPLYGFTVLVPFQCNRGNSTLQISISVFTRYIQRGESVAINCIRVNVLSVDNNMPVSFIATISSTDGS